MKKFALNQKLLSFLACSVLAPLYGYVGYEYQFTNMTGVPIDIRITATAGNDQREHLPNGETVVFRTGIACLSSVAIEAIDFWGTTGPGWTENENNDKTIVDKSFYAEPVGQFTPGTGANIQCGGFSGKFYLTTQGKLAFKKGDFKNKTGN